MADKMYLDIETFSSVDLKTSGVYKYCESIDFEILLICYANNDGEVKRVKLAEGEHMPISFLDRMRDPKVEKHAHNASFERTCFKAVGLNIPAEQWHCSSVKAAYCGFPLSLKGVSEALNLGEKSKMTTGSSLIRYFCIPCKPKKTNGQRSRNLWYHNLVKWSNFILYCDFDVIAEREVDKALQIYRIPDFERLNYLLDQKINDRGILVDLVLAHSAYSLDNDHISRLKKRLGEITGLRNPNSLAQLKQWLGLKMGREVKSLTKDSVPVLITETDNEEVKDVLRLRVKSSKTSTKKYAAMIKCACDDNRAHGLFQFYGANRTGRWAGRMVQLQNLRRNNLKDLETARDLVRNGGYENIIEKYEDVSDVLSQLTRTAFVADEGKHLAVADFSAIEARVIAWLADEKWRLDVFSSHGKIYEASASMMFGVPIEEITKGSDLRSRGKVAELALGYQGGVNALKEMGGEAMGLSETEMSNIVKVWRKSNPKIVKLWKNVQAFVVRAVKSRKKLVLTANKNLIFESDGDTLTIQLPSGRKLCYQSPTISENRFGTESVKYKGLNQATRKWWWTDSYGGKFVENIVQAIARDILADSMLRLDKAGFDIVMHVHDEAICETPTESKEEDLKTMCDIMGGEIGWAIGLPLDADGYTTPFYKKD
jgi:DNA polymerase